MSNAAVVATKSRQTKYTSAVREVLEQLGHGTNRQIWEIVSRDYPEVSLTTIHRVTARLKTQGVIGCAPKTSKAEERYDANPTPHHHFMCSVCDRLCDFSESQQARTAIESLGELSGDCWLAEMVTLQGVCKKCAK